MKILFVPPPRAGGGPSNAVLRVKDVLQAHNHLVTTNIFGHWNCALLNVGVGVRFDVLRSVRLGRRVVYRVDGCYVEEIFRRQKRPWDSAYAKINKRIGAALRMADHVVYQSSFSKTHLLDRLVTPAEGSYSIIPNGVDLSVFSPSNRNGNPIPIVGCIGTFRGNRIKNLVDISNRLSFKHRLLIVGRLDEECERDLRGSQETGREHREIEYVSQVTSDIELVAQFRKIDCFIHPIIGDTCSNAVIEALACGVPVIVPRWSGSSSLVGDGGLVVEQDPWDDYDRFVLGYAEAVTTILGSQQGFSLRARNVACSKFDVNETASQYEAVLAGQ